MTLRINPDPKLPWPLDYEHGVLPIAESESCLLAAYQCEAGVWTCGWGETDGVGPATRWTQEFADQRFCDSLHERAVAVKAACTVAPTPHQLAALVAFAYNYGGWRTSQVMKCHNAGDYLAASRAFSLVNKVTDPVTKKKKVSNGLTARRAWEAALYLRPADGAGPLPQAPAGESSLGASPIANSGAVAAGTGLVSLVGSASAGFTSINTTLKEAKAVVVETLGVPTDWFLPMVMIGAGVVVWWFRVKQRRQGWA